MNLGSQATIAGADPPNLCHLVFSNGMHPIQSLDKLDFAGIALGCGVSRHCQLRRGRRFGCRA